MPWHAEEPQQQHETSEQEQAEAVSEEALPSRPRFFTPREVARLQGFPESFLIDGPNVHRWYYQCGNAVCPGVVAKIAKKMLAALKLPAESTESREPRSTEEQPLRAVEFFAGLGGWSCALKQPSTGGADPLPPVEVVAAYEVDRVCCDVFAHNHGLRPSNQSIETLDAAALSAHRADLWVLSPPCQPFTRGGSAKVRDDGDNRSAALLRLLQVLGEMDAPPAYWLMENVAGFCGTNSWRRMHAVLSSRGYRVEEYLLCPSELLGVPNIRLRYYCVATLRAAAGGGCSAPTTSSADMGQGDVHIPRELPSASSAAGASPKPLSHYLERDAVVHPEAAIDVQALFSKAPTFRFEIVRGDAMLTSCFTKSCKMVILSRFACCPSR